MSAEAAVDKLKSELRGQLILPEDADYEEACKVYNAMIEKRPRLIARCFDVADVISAVNFARENTLLVAVRGGGHNGAGLGICDDGLVIDLSLMRGVHVDPKARTIRAQGGCQWGDLDHAGHPFGLTTPAGTISTTGVAGLTLGGGIGHLTRKYGLTIDNLLAVDMVLADGSFVTAGAEENQDLYWAVRGGGGNFGAVTSFLFRACPVKTVVAGPMFWPMEKATEVMQWYREFIVQAPEELGGFFAFLTVPPGPPFPEHLHLKKVCGVVWCYAGPEAEADKVFKPIRAFGPPIFDFVGPAPFPAIQSMFDPVYPPGLQWYWRADFLNELSDEAIKLHAEWGAKMPTMHSTAHFYPIDGAVHKVGKDDTPFHHRDSKWAHVIVGVDPDPANKEKITNWTKDYFDALHPHSDGGAYINFMMEEGQSRIEATYRDGYKRLTEIKKKYDPTNFFRVNQNIKPAA